MQILVVDDSKFSRNLVSSMLKDTDHEIIEASNSDEAIEKFKKFRPKLVLMDIIMPDTDGIKSLQELKKIDQNSRIVMCTSVGEQKQFIQQALSAGASDILTKPFTKEELEKIIQIVEQS